MEPDPLSYKENDRLSVAERMHLRHQEESLKNSNAKSFNGAHPGNLELGRCSGDKAATTLPTSTSVFSNTNHDGNLVTQDFDMSSKANYTFQFHNNTDQDGASLEMIQSSIELSYTIPPKPGSKWFSIIEGESVFFKQRGFTSTQMTLGYRILDGLSLLYSWDTKDGSSINSYGMKYERGDTKTTLKIQYPRHKGNLASVTLLTTSTLRKKLISHFHMGYNFLSRNGELFYNPIVFQIGLKTNSFLQELNQRIPQLSCSMDAFHKLPFQVDYIQPNQAKHASFQVGLAFNRRQFQIQSLLTRFISEFHQFSIGIGHASWEGMSWILKWQMGDVCLDIPIRITVPGSTLRESVFYAFRCAYFGILSQIIHSVIGEALLLNDGEASNTSFYLHREQNLLEEESKKYRIEAERQQMVMRKKAESNRRTEEIKGGLVIENAFYAIECGDTLDVTVALQFWVSDSRLVLQGNDHTYGTMLGFYDIRSTYKDTTCVEIDHATDNNTNVSFLESMNLLWRALKNWNNDDFNTSSVTPFLHVKYRYNNETYEFRVNDNETLILPNPQAHAL